MIHPRKHTRRPSPHFLIKALFPGGSIRGFPFFPMKSHEHIIYPQILCLETVCSYKVKGDPGPPNNGTLLWQVSHTSPISLRIHYRSGMGIVWETYHKGVTLLGIPENPPDRVIQQSPKKLPAFKTMHLTKHFRCILVFFALVSPKKQIDLYIYHQFTCVCFSGVFLLILPW